MSSYLTIYAKIKGVDKKVTLWAFSRSSEIYQFFYENNLSCCVYNNLDDTEEQFKQLSKNEFLCAVSGLNEEIYRDEKRYCFDEKHAKSAEDLANLYSTREYIDEKIELKHNLDMILYLLQDIEFGGNDIEALYTNYG